MQVLINVPDTLPQAIIQQRIKALEESLQKEAQHPEKTVSKWEAMAQRIAAKAFDLGDHTDSFNQDRQTFRASFAVEDKR